MCCRRSLVSSVLIQRKNIILKLRTDVEINVIKNLGALLVRYGKLHWSKTGD